MSAAPSRPSVSRRDATREWRQLSAGQRREVAKLAKLGKRHADGRVAAIAYRWAQAVLPPKDTKHRSWGANFLQFTLGAVVDGLTGGLTDFAGGVGGGIVYQWKVRRLAERIIGASENTLGGDRKNGDV